MRSSRAPSEAKQKEAATPATRCRAPADGDALDLELANRLNARLEEPDRSADYMRSMRPIFREIIYWGLATACLLAAAAYSLVR